jgi:hypothetical protein
MEVILRDGGNTNTPDEPNSLQDRPLTNAQRGHHESEGSYFECKTRDRNDGLFHADQNLNGNDARFTRQNNNGNRRGLECAEERDYYPYWIPTMWRDIVYLTDDVSRCQYIKDRSQNNNLKWKCVGTNEQIKQSLSESKCLAAGGQWKSWTWGIPAPACEQVGWSRVNHLGNGREGQALSYNWTLPTFTGDLAVPNNKIKLFGAGQNYAKCIVRLRYNISTDDYNPWNINSTQDDDPQRGIVSPVTNNPTVDVGADLQGLRLAINTAQFGRTFQDRSHVFYIKKSPFTLPAGAKMYNLNVRGKRGNIVQTYPSVEYDFMPNRLHVTTDDLVHIQWTGSNTHNNGDPAGDGQAGDAGEGTGGTDRHNIVQLLNLDDNFPVPYDKFPDNMFQNNKCFLPDGTPIPQANWVDCALILATSGYLRDHTAIATDFDPLLNNAPASLVGGIVMSFSQIKQINYACTRNNNFSNRSQKGVLIVSAPTP